MDPEDPTRVQPVAITLRSSGQPADIAQTMSVSPSLPPGAPSLAEVIARRTFAKPPSAFIDGEFIEALTKADIEARRSAASAAAPAAPPAAAAPPAHGVPAPRIDVRA
jgi:hypothetical protein